jgi:excisionase family DNA binding protein
MCTGHANNPNHVRTCNILKSARGRVHVGGTYPTVTHERSLLVHLGARMETKTPEVELISERITTFERLLSADEAAAHLRIHPKTLQRMARLGHVPGIRIGKYWRFHLSKLDAWVRSLENVSSQPFRVK